MKIVEYYRPQDYSESSGYKPIKTSVYKKKLKHKRGYIPVSKARNTLNKLVCKLSVINNCTPKQLWLKIKLIYSREVLKETCIDSYLDDIQFSGTWLDFVEACGELEKLEKIAFYI